MNVTILRCLFALAATTIALPLALADSLTGKVLDPQGAAVPNAQLTLFDKVSSAQRRATSSATGDYSFQEVAAGAYLVEVQGDVTGLAMSEEIVVSGATTKDLALSLARSTVRVTVTATNTPLSEQEVAKVIDVVDLEEINRRDEFSITEALRNLPGVRVRQQGGPGSFVTIATRGMRTRDTAVLIDGLRFRDAAASEGDASGFLADLHVVDVSRVEFLRGAGSSLYGTNAMAGVINIGSGQGGGRTRGSIRTEGGGLGMLRGTANIGGGVAEDRLVYSGGYSHLNVINGIRGNMPYRNNSVQAFAKLKLTGKMSLTGRIWGSGAYLGGIQGATFNAATLANFPATGPVPAIALAESQVKLYEQGLPFSVGNATFIPSVGGGSDRRSSSFTGAVVFAHELTPSTSYKISYQGVNTNRDHSGYLSPVSHSHYDGRTDTVQARLDTRVGRIHLVSVGYEFEHERFHNLETEQQPSPADGLFDISQQNHALYAQDQIGLLDGRLQVALSGRIQTFALQDVKIEGQSNPYLGATFANPDNAYTGDVSVAYFVAASQTKLRGHVGNSYRAPSPYERFGASYYGGAYGFFGDPRLKPERSVAFDAGVDQWLMNSRIRLGLTYFYTNLSETIDFGDLTGDDPFGIYYGYKNSKTGGIARGVELSSQFALTSGTDVQFNYTLTNSDQRTPTIGTSFYEIPWVSKNQVSLTVMQRLTRRLNVTMDWSWAGDYSYSPYGANGRQMVFAGPNKTDFVLNYTIPVGDFRSVEIYGKLENAFDVRYFEAGSTTPGIWGLAGMKVNF